eukprot:TRINITY_DN6966_c1_g1_i1.p1 TRINITY_DN6966_c1_g1~~TRINITY_DN6966_c1_g1_i1.p1  ORF type:complete len:121 (+),score=2.20 TRINITY_DN6966_c1_g1_i1:188-550(+)
MLANCSPSNPPYVGKGKSSVFSWCTLLKEKKVRTKVFKKNKKNQHHLCVLLLIFPFFSYCHRFKLFTSMPTCHTGLSRVTVLNKNEELAVLLSLSIEYFFFFFYFGVVQCRLTAVCLTCA